jgi:hypothetical protein
LEEKIEKEDIEIVINPAHPRDGIHPIRRYAPRLKRGIQRSTGWLNC